LEAVKLEFQSIKVASLGLEDGLLMVIAATLKVVGRETTTLGLASLHVTAHLFS